MLYTRFFFVYLHILMLFCRVHLYKIILKSFFLNRAKKVHFFERFLVQKNFFSTNDRNEATLRTLLHMQSSIFPHTTRENCQ